MSIQRFIVLHILFLCASFVCGQSGFEVIEVLSCGPSGPLFDTEVVVPSDSALYYANIMKCLDSLGYAKDSVEFENLSRVCGGFFLSAHLDEEQSCPPVSKDKDVLCISRYTVGGTIVPYAYDDYRPIKKEYIEVKEPPIHNCPNFFLIYFNVAKDKFRVIYRDVPLREKYENDKNGCYADK
jgi:hypothetical protein